MPEHRRPSCSRLLRASVLLLATLATHPVRAEPVDVVVPLQLDDVFLSQAVASQVYTDAGGSARVWDDGSGCNHMVLTNPRIDAVGGRLRLLTDGEARVGRAFGDRCLLVLEWAGALETYQEVSVEPGGAAIRFEVVDSGLPDGGPLSGTLWNLVKDHVHPRIGTVRIDLQPALNELRAVLPFLLPGDPVAVAAILDSVALHAVEVTNGGLEAVLGFRIEAAGLPEVEAQGPEPPLTPEELARFQAATRSWDSFITFIVKYLAATAASVDVRRELLFVLIEARYDILNILAEEPSAGRADPVRLLFVRTWSRLAPLLRRLSPTQPGQQGLNLLSFIAAADALQALDAIGPRINLELSADGLRRMARVLVPESPTDPLEYQEGVDPELRGLFDFGPPPAPRQDPVVPVPDAQPPAEPQGLLPGLLIPGAFAASGDDEERIARLNRWLPGKEDIADYLPLVRDLLNRTARNVLEGSMLDSGYHELYRALVLATAWQETCWRQYTVENDKLVPIRSTGGAVGMMQVIPSVWRGFYDPNGLSWDIAYNTVAGSEILLHYLVDYAIARGEHEHQGGVDNLPRAAYAAYNGGPRHLSRYRSGDTSESLQRIDQAFWDKFRAISNGDELAVQACFEG